MEQDKQQLAIEAIKSGKNVFITGSGGVGKSWVIQQVTDKNTVVVAPTGIAALNVQGITCHKAFGLPIGLVQQSDYAKPNRNVNNLFGGVGVKRIIIDEVGMLRSDYLDLINHRLQQARYNKLPFGGIQVVLVGDFYQLEPIVSEAEQSFFFKKYTTPFAFGAKCWNFDTIELDKVYRQSDVRQVQLLNSIRKKEHNYTQSLAEISAMSLQSDEDCLHLCSYKKDAFTINTRYFNEVKGQSKTYTAYVSGKWNDSEKAVDDMIQIKVGCKVLICANDMEGTYVNGDRGVVTALHPDSVDVLLDSGNTVNVEYFTWEKYEYSKVGRGFSKDVCGMFKQLPIRLGWAIVVHKAQGMTLDKVSLDVGRGCFSHGQLYVALSRVRNLEQLHLSRPLKEEDVILRSEVKDFYGHS